MRTGILQTQIFGANRCLTDKTKNKMKKNLFMVAAVALMVFSACNKEEINYGAGAPVGSIEFVAGFDVDTKTTLEAGKTEWVAGDEISINGVKFVAQNDGPTSTFLNAEEPAEDFGAPFTAIYPYGSDGVPSEQTAYAGNFDPMAVVETATSNDHNLKFKNESSLLKFRVPTACDRVVLTSEDNLAKNSTTVTVKGGFVTGTDYYVAVLPGTKSKFNVKVDDYVVKSAESVIIGRSSIIPMALPYNVYLHAKTSKYDWTSDGARFATWTWGTGVTDSWFNMIAEEGHDGVYRLEVPAGYANLIFCRLDGAKELNDWANVWNQTGDLTIPEDNANHFYISDSGAGAWGDKDYTFPVVKPKDGYLYLRPSSEWLQASAHFAAWIWKDNGAGKVYNFKPHESVPGLYELNLNGANKMILFRMDPSKKVTDGSTAWPGDNHWYKSGDLNITGNLYTVVGWQAAGTGFSTVTEF